MGFLEEHGIAVYVPPRRFPFPVRYIEPQQITNVESGYRLTYEIPQDVASGRFRFITNKNVSSDSLRFFVDNKEVVAECFGIRFRCSNDYKVFPVDMGVGNKPSNDPSQGYISDTDGYYSFELDFDGASKIDVLVSSGVYSNVATNAEIWVYEFFESIGWIEADSWLKQKVYWFGEDDVYAKPAIAASGPWLLIIDETRSFVYNVVTDETIDVSPPAGIYTGTDTGFYLAIGSKLYRIPQPFGEPEYVEELPFIPDTAINNGRGVFVKFRSNMSVTTSIFTFSIQGDTSYTYQSGAETLNGRLTTDGLAITVGLYNDTIYVVVLEKGSYVVYKWTPQETTRTPLETLPYECLEVLCSDIYELEPNRQLPTVQTSAITTALGFCGRWWMAEFDGVGVALYWVDPYHTSGELKSVGEWVEVTEPVYLDVSGKIEVETVEGTFEFTPPVIVSPTEYIVKIKSFFDIFPDMGAIKSVFGSINKICIVQGSYPMTFNDEIKALLESKYGVPVEEIAPDQYQNSETVLHILTPGAYTFKASSGQSIYFRIAALIPGTVWVNVYGAHWTSHGRHYYSNHYDRVHGVFYWANNTDYGQAYLYNCVTFQYDSALDIQNNCLRYQSGSLNGIAMDWGTFYKTITFADLSFYLQYSGHVLSGDYAWGDIVPVASQDFSVPVVVGKRYRIVYTRQKVAADYELYNYGNTDYVGPAYLETDIDAAEVVFDNGLVGKVFTATSGKKYIYIPEITIPAGSLVKLNIASTNDTTSITDGEGETYFYPFDENTSDLHQLQSWETTDVNFEDNKCVVLGELSKQVGSVGSLIFDLDSFGYDHVLYVDGIPIIKLFENGFMVR